MGKLILVRHGQSAWNEKNLFSGWVDIPLSEKGVQEAYEVGDKLALEPIDIVYTSSLVRSHMTVGLALLRHSSRRVPVFLHPGQGKLDAWGKIYSDAIHQEMIPVYSAWELNERMYGELQGLNKAELAKQYGAEQVHRWRRSFDEAPPGGESLKMTAERTLPYFKKEVVPRLDQGKNILIVAHGNSLRSIVMHLERMTPDQIVRREFATGELVTYHWPLTQ